MYKTKGGVGSAATVGAGAGAGGAAGSDGEYVVLTAGATCFGVPPPNNQRWGGTGIFVYTALLNHFDTASASQK
jgi:hypothetical protein